jgi:SET domain-containing protein
MKSGKRPKLEIRATRKYGKGVFAAEDIEKGRIVWVLDGERMDALDLVERVNADAENINDPLQIGKRTYIDLDEVSRTFNHSCNPSTGIRKTSEMFALRGIKKGEELTYDYSATIAPTEWKMRCKCGSRNCRGILGDVLSVPREQLDYYKRHGAIQKYMKAILTDVEAGRYMIPKYELAALAKLKRTSEEV